MSRQRCAGGGGWWVRCAALLALLAACKLAREPTPAVQVRGGWLRGRLSDDGQYYHYSGVPYATTTADTRFQAPSAAPAWEGVLEAIESTRCPQRMFGDTVLGRADCLTLDVYAPVRRPTRSLLPVMVYIHGGCFFEGTGSPFLYGPDYLLRHGVVFVGVNYRLNIEGFLCLGTKEAPGNAGLKDQLAALRWLRDNVRAFGGDPDNVTLFGESAGAVSTALLMLSPSARGLFHKAILQSGATLAPWALQHRPLRTASALARQLGYETEDPHQLYHIFTNRTHEELIRARIPTRNSESITADLLFVPCVERAIPGVEAIITEHPSDIIMSGNYTKVPMIVGYNDNEGIYFLAKDYGTSPKRVDTYEALQPDLEFPNEKEKRAVAAAVEDHYFSESKDNVSRMIDLYSDVHFKFPIVVESELYARSAERPIYYYQFKYSGLINMPKVIAGFALTGGASHADELLYLFKPHSFPLPQRFLEFDMIEKMTTMWTNFAKYGEPTPVVSELLPVKWQPSHEQNPLALHIGRSLSLAPLWDPGPVRLWNATYATYRRRSYGFH